MAHDGSDAANLYSMVSSLYGPGTTACWYLTALSCFASWTLHPKKRVSGSIDPDFVAFLTFPAVAAGHLISQVHGYPGSREEMLTTDDPALLKLVSAIEASLNVTENYMTICVVSLLIAVWFKCVNRAMLLAVTGLFCFSAEGYLFRSISHEERVRNLSRPFLFNFAGVFIAVLVLLVVLITATFGLVFMFYVDRLIVRCTTTYGEPNGSMELGTVIEPRGSVATEVIEELEPRREFEIIEVDRPDFNRKAILDSRNIKLISFMTFAFLPISFFASMLPMTMDIFSMFTPSHPSWLRAGGSRLIEDMFPRTNVTIKELDQSVALLAGCTVVGFSLYSAADAQYQKWRAQVQDLTREQQRRRGQSSENRIRAPLVVNQPGTQTSQVGEDN